MTDTIPIFGKFQSLIGQDNINNIKEPENKNLILIKIISFVIILGISLLFGLLPYFW